MAGALVASHQRMAATDWILTRRGMCLFGVFRESAVFAQPAELWLGCDGEVPLVLRARQAAGIVKRYTRRFSGVPHQYSSTHLLAGKRARVITEPVNKRLHRAGVL